MQLFDFSRPTYYKWKRENTPALKLLEKYFTEKELIEYLEVGTITRLEEHNISNLKLELHEKVLEDNAFYTAKDKLTRFFSSRLLIKDILIDVLNQMSSSEYIYTIENTKQSLIQQLKGSEINWLKTKTQAKIDLLSEFVENNISDIESYAMVKNPKIVLDLKTK